MELLQLRYFVTVAELENVTAAARAHNIPQPAMSSMILKLEKELNVKLFDRVGNHVVLNDEGRAFFAYARKALNAISDGVQYLNDRNGQLETRITLVVNTNRDQIIDCMEALQKERPDVRYTVYHHMQENGKDNPFDLCITSYPLNFTDVKSVALHKSKILLAIPPANPLYTYEGEFTPEVLGDQSYMLTRATNDIGNRVRAYFNKIGIAPNIILNCNEPHYLKRYMGMNAGIAFVAESYKKYLPDNIRYVAFDSSELYQTVRMYWHTNKYVSKTVRCLRTLIIEYYKDNPYD